MPRNARIDAPGALQHIICRGIERRKIFLDDADRDQFVDRLGSILKKTATSCYAWALVPNHFHLLVRTGKEPLSAVMRRLLTGYAVWFNRRHHRHGHLFQNRYKSILCQEEPYLLELVRYIHLNPLRARIVKGFNGLADYPYCGHSAILRKKEQKWQDITYVLELFGGKQRIARQRYGDFIQDGIAEGKRPDLTGGGLVRSMGGWSSVKAMRKANRHEMSDERILGDGDFVEGVLKECEERMDRRTEYQARGYVLKKIGKRVEETLGVNYGEVRGPGKERWKVEARDLYCYWAVEEVGYSMTEVGRELGIRQPTVSIAAKRGREMAKERGYRLAK